MPTRLLLLSDTHLPMRAKALQEQVWRMVDEADVVVHAGDWVELALLDALEARAARLVGVAGNNDGPELWERLGEVARIEVDGVRLPLITSEKRQHRDSRGNPTFPPSTEVGILTPQRQDVYGVLAGAIGEDAEVRINFNPLVVWVWYGGLLMAIGGLIVMWPTDDRRRRQVGYVAELEPQAVGVGA